MTMEFPSSFAPSCEPAVLFLFTWTLAIGYWLLDIAALLLLVMRRGVRYALGVTFKGVQMILSYIDPGSGSILIQVLLASCVGGIAIFWGRIKALFTGKKSDPSSSPSDSPKSE